MSRRSGVSIALPGERHGRRTFLVRGTLGAVGVGLVAAGGGAWLGARRTRPDLPRATQLRVFTPEEATILLAIAHRLVPPREGFPTPEQVDLATRMDRVAALAHPATQGELKTLLRVFDSALTGWLLHGHAELFTAAPPHRQDARLGAWAQSRFGLRRTAYRGLRRLIYAAYYASSETWPAVGYPGPPFRPTEGGARPAPLPPRAATPAPAPAAPAPGPDASPAPAPPDAAAHAEGGHG